VDGKRLLKEVRAGRHAPVIADFCNKICQKQTRRLSDHLVGASKNCSGWRRNEALPLNK